MAYTVVVDDKAEREIRSLPRDDQRRVLNKIAALADDPRPAGCVKLTGTADLWRIRVGVHRIVYQILDNVLLVTVLRVAHRRDVYR